jgi:hypothetical protein
MTGGTVWQAKARAGYLVIGNDRIAVRWREKVVSRVTARAKAAERIKFLSCYRFSVSPSPETVPGFGDC